MQFVPIVLEGQLALGDPPEAVEALEAMMAAGMERQAQNIKNSAAQQTQSIRGLKAAFRVAMTGTPVENRLSELWSIMEFLNPGYLGTQKDFRSRYAVPIERYRDQGRAASLRRLAQPFILRRLKTDPRVIQDLPEKQESRRACPSEDCGGIGATA